MPIFEFACGGCGRRFEEIMTFAQMEVGEAACPDCGGKQVERAMSTFASSVGGSDAGPPCGGGGCGGGGGGFT